MKRVLTALAMVPPVLYVVLGGPWWLLFAVVALVAGLCYAEYSGIAEKYGAGKLGPMGYAAGLLGLLLPPAEGFTAAAAFALIAMVFSMRSGELAQALPRAALMAFGVLYVFGCWKFALLLHTASPHWLMYALLLNWVGDIGAFYAGRTWGRHKLAPRVSPGKSGEGAVASVIAAAAAGAVYLGYFLPAVPLWQVAALTVAANAAGQVGDLAESAMKRGAGVKDSGAILPGHGGFLDRVDSTLFTLPLVYLYLRLSS